MLWICLFICCLLSCVRYTQANFASLQSSPSNGLAVATSLDGFIYVTGDSTGNSGSEDIFLTKWDSNGNIIWTKLLGTPQTDVGNSVSVSPDGLFIYVTGYTTGNLSNQINAGSYDIFLTKWDSNGNLIWTKLLGTPQYDVGFSASVSPDGLFIFVTGATAGNLSNQINAGSEDIFLTKWDSNGNIIWTKLLGTSQYDIGFSASVSPDGLFIYVTGETAGNLNNQINAGGADMFLTKWDSNGNIIWTKLLGTPQYDYGNSVSVSPDGLFIFVTGYTDGNLSGKINAGSYDIFLTKWDSNGNLIWTQLYGTPSADYGVGMSINSNNSFVYITGYTFGNLSGQINANTGSSEAFLIQNSNPFTG